MAVEPDNGKATNTPDEKGRFSTILHRPGRSSSAASSARPSTPSSTASPEPTSSTVTTESHHSPDRAAVLARQKQQFGGFHWKVAFFGWLTATGAAVLLTAIATALGTLAGMSGTGDQISPEAGIGGAVLVLIAVSISYFIGGYVAGRMARFNGPKQGLAVWLVSILGSAVIALIGLVSGPGWDALGSLTVLPRIPVNDGLLTAAGIITAVIALAATLGSAMAGGLIGTRFHRKIDRVGFDS